MDHGLGFPWPLLVDQRERERRGIDSGLAVRPWSGSKGPTGPAHAAGLGGDDVITAANGRSPNVSGRPFMVWFRLAHEPGDAIS